jgi:chemotaxis response regulator CheB
MSNLQRRGSYTPRRAREQRAYRLAVLGASSGGLGAISVVLAAVGVVTWGLPIILLIIAAVSAFGFMRATGQR